MASQSGYRGRFAPTPSGPLHLGSLLTAVASYAQARHRRGQWLLRIDDLDRERCPPANTPRILRQLEAHGFRWDEAPRIQTEHIDDYGSALGRLRARGAVYACACTRATLRATSHPGPDGPVYPGTCRARALTRGSVRLRIGTGLLCFDDAWQGRQCRDGASEIGDFVVQRNDGVFGYQLACAVDEVAQGITEVVRGADLLGSTFQQRWVLEQLGSPSPDYRHLPVLLGPDGLKLSKQNHAVPIDGRNAAANLLACLTWLRQAPELALRRARPAQILDWAVANWDAAKVPRTAQIAEALPYNAVQQSLRDAP